MGWVASWLAVHHRRGAHPPPPPTPPLPTPPHPQGNINLIEAAAKLGVKKFVLVREEGKGCNPWGGARGGWGGQGGGGSMQGMWTV